jgi:hypothetical protein
MPNGTTIQSSHTCNLLLTDLPHQARQAHILPGLVHNSLISVGQVCDNEYSFTFTHDRLWWVNLNQKLNPDIAQCNHAHDNNNQKDLINYLHDA